MRTARSGSMLEETAVNSMINPGWAVRVLHRRGRRLEDSVRFQTHESDWFGVEDPENGSELEVLAHWPIRVNREGPAVVVNRVLPVAFRDPETWITEALRGVETPRLMDVEQNPMPDEEFWQYMSVLRDGLNQTSLTRLIDRLSSLSYRQIIGFRDALWQKLHDLDHPRNTVGSDDGEESIVSADASLYYRCEIVARGEEAYQSAVQAPRPGAGEDGASGEVLLGIADDVAPSPLIPALVEIETGRNGANWPGAEPAPWLRIPSVSAFSPGVLNPWSDTVDQQLLSRLSFFSFVAYSASAEGHVRELMGCLMAISPTRAREELIPFLDSQLDDGEILDPRVRVWRSGARGPMVGVAITDTTRRTSMTLEEYKKRYIDGSSI